MEDRVLSGLAQSRSARERQQRVGGKKDVTNAAELIGFRPGPFVWLECDTGDQISRLIGLEIRPFVCKQ